LSTSKYLVVSVKSENRKVKIFLKNISSRIIRISSFTVKREKSKFKTRKTLFFTITTEEISSKVIFVPSEVLGINERNEYEINLKEPLEHGELYNLIIEGRADRRRIRIIHTFKA